MTIRHISFRSTLMSGLFVIGGLLAVPSAADAAGFFEQLFGGGASDQVESPAPSVQYDRALPAPDGIKSNEIRRARRVAERDAKPVLQKPTDLMQDRTLRAGDPVMMKDGIHIYSGPESSHHSARQFVALDQAHVAAKTRIALVAMDASEHDPLEYAPLREGRSASDGAAMSNGLPISPGYKITDASGKSVRYVGP